MHGSRDMPSEVGWCFSVDFSHLPWEEEVPHCRLFSPTAHKVLIGELKGWLIFILDESLFWFSLWCWRRKSMGVAKEVDVEFSMVASGIQNSQGVESVVDFGLWILCWFWWVDVGGMQLFEHCLRTWICQWCQELLEVIIFNGPDWFFADVCLGPDFLLSWRWHRQGTFKLNLLWQC